MAQPAKKEEDNLREKWHELQPEVGGSDSDYQWNPLHWIRKVYFRFFGPRRHPRKPITFSHPLRVRVLAGKDKIELVAEDISRGGMGIKCTREQSNYLPEGKVLTFEIALDGQKFERVQGEVRFAKIRGLNAFIGVKFTEVSSNLLAAIDNDQKQQD